MKITPKPALRLTWAMLLPLLLLVDGVSPD